MLTCTASMTIIDLFKVALPHSTGLNVAFAREAVKNVGEFQPRNTN
jgi:hypothetical protein